MITEKLKELAAARAKLASLEAAIAAERDAELSTLPAQFGFADTTSFISAVKAATGKMPKRRGRKPKAAVASAGKTRRKRTTITDAMRVEVKKLVSDGKSGTEIANAVGISLPSVQNIKAKLGLVKKRKK